MPPNVAAKQNDVVRPHVLGSNLNASGDFPNSRGRDEDSITLAAIHYLGVACNDVHSCSVRSLPHSKRYAPQLLNLETFLEHECRTQVERRRAAHGKIVHRTVYSKLTDVAAWKPARTHHITIRGEGGSLQAADIQRRAIVASIEIRIGERIGEESRDQVVHQAPAAAMRHQDAGVSAQWNGALQIQDGTSNPLGLLRAAAGNGKASGGLPARLLVRDP